MFAGVDDLGLTVGGRFLPQVIQDHHGLPRGDIPQVMLLLMPVKGLDDPGVGHGICGLSKALQELVIVSEDLQEIATLVTVAYEMFYPYSFECHFLLILHILSPQIRLTERGS